MKQKLHLSSNEYDFLKTPHLIKNYCITKIGRKTCLLCEMEDVITVWHNNKVNIFNKVLLIKRVWLGSSIKKLSKFPIEVHIIDYNSIKNKSSLKGSFNIAWGNLQKL